MTAFSVESPKIPSAFPVRKPSSISASCRDWTSWPVDPFLRILYPPAFSSGDRVGTGEGVGVTLIFPIVFSTIYSVRTQPLLEPYSTRAQLPFFASTEISAPSGIRFSSSDFTLRAARRFTFTFVTVV